MPANHEAACATAHGVLQAASSEYFAALVLEEDCYRGMVQLWVFCQQLLHFRALHINTNGLQHGSSSPSAGGL